MNLTRRFQAGVPPRRDSHAVAYLDQAPLRCPSDVGDDLNAYGRNYTTNNYPISLQIGAVNSKIGLRDITDGSSNTFMRGERRLQTDPVGGRYTGAIVWGRTDQTDASYHFRSGPQINFSPTPFTSASNPSSGDPGCTRHVTSSAHAGGAHFLMGDGAVRFVSENIGHNPAAYSPTGPCLGTDPALAGPGFVCQNLFFRADGNPVEEF